MPAANRIHGELRRVMADAEAHPGGVRRHVVDAIGRHFAEVLVDVMHLYRIGTACRMTIAAGVLVLATCCVPRLSSATLLRFRHSRRQPFPQPQTSGGPARPTDLWRPCIGDGSRVR